MKLVAFVLLAVGLIVGGTGAGILAARKNTTSGFTHTKATLVAVMQDEGPNTVKPVVEFQANGKTVRQSTGSVAGSSLTASPGDEVDIAYRDLGWRGYDIILDQNDVDEMMASRNLASTILGWLFLGLGAVIIIVAIILMR